MIPQTQEIQQLLYFGSLAQYVNFSVVKGQYYEYEEGELFSQPSNESLQRSLQYRFTQNQLGLQYQNLLIPCNPSFDICTLIPQQKLQEGQLDYQQDKSVLRSVLIKTKDQDAFQIKGFQSGKRSSIFPYNQKFYRLKGCGNLLEGFPSQLIPSRIPNTVEIRGSHFQHTVKRELLMTDKITKLLQEHGIQCANRSVGYWKYDPQFEVGTDLKNDFPLVDKFCCIFETIGEKRVMTHLIQGINMILVAISDLFKDEINNKSILELFNKDRFSKDKPDFPDQTPVDYIDSTEIQSKGGLKEKLKQPIFTESQEQNLANFLNHFQKNDLLNDSKNPQDQTQQLCNKIKNMFKIFEGYNQVMDEILNHLQQSTIKDITVQISFIYARIGYEIGRIVRIFQENEISWGYYNDHDPFLFHCNAHPNNLVLVPDFLESNNLLAPLDFDLAFYKNEFININYEDPNYAKNDAILFDQYQEQSRQNLEYCLAGLEMMENFNFQTFDFKSLEEKSQKTFEIFHNGLRDTMRIYYMQGFEKKEMKTDVQVKNNLLMHSLVKVSLILTGGFLC